MSAKKIAPNKPQAETTPADVNLDALAVVARQTRNLLAYQLQLGISLYPATDALVRIAARKSARPADPVPGQKHFTKPVEQYPATAPATTKVSSVSSARQLKVIGNNLRGCRKCASASQVVVPGQGSHSPRLFVIGDWFAGTGEPDGLIWGPEEDDLLWKMMSAIGLDRDSVYVTNCVKCRPKAGESPGTEYSSRCFTYLEQELMAIGPEMICTMGEIATNVLLKSSAPLVRMRGRFHQYRYPHGTSARVMPTFHPRFLIQHPEMKRATWMDLQAVQRLLEGSTRQ